MNRKHRLLTFAVFLLLLCSFILSAFPVSAEDSLLLGTHAGLLAKGQTIENALTVAFLQKANEMEMLADEYRAGIKLPTAQEGGAAAKDEVADLLEDEAARLRTLTFDSYALAIVDNAYENEYVGAYKSMVTLADEMTDTLVTLFPLEALTTELLVSDALIHAYMRAIGDTYASYFNEEEFAEYKADTEAQYGGIGVTVTQLEDGYVEVLAVTPNSPAEKAGILLGDIIVAVEGDDFVELGYSAAINRIRGEEGKSVTITVKRGNDTFDVTLVRTTLTEYTVSYKMLSAGDGKIGYVRISQFDEGTFLQFVEAIDALGRQGAEKFVFDVRNNLGGRLEAVLAVLEYILPEKDGMPLIRMEYKSETISYKTTAEYLSDNGADKDTVKQYAKAKNHQIDSPITVLCNGFTASAGELFTSCLKDFGAARIIGEKTYGKGVGQTGYKMTDYYAYAGKNITYFREALFNITTFYYSPPLSENYEGVGITPDVEASLSEEATKINFYKLTEEMDDQLKAATDYLATQGGVPYVPSSDGEEGDLILSIVLWTLFSILALVIAALVAFLVGAAVIEKKKKQQFYASYDAARQGGDDSENNKQG